MLHYLFINHGQKYYHSIGQWIESLATVKKRWDEYTSRGLDIFVLESKSPCECIYRLKKRIDGKWHNSKWIDTTQEIYAEPMFRYVDENMDKYISYREHKKAEWGEIVSMAEWVHRNDQAIREFIYWLYNNGYIEIK